MAYVSTYHLGDTDPPRDLTLQRPDKSGWLDPGDTVVLIDHFQNGTVVPVPATVTAYGDEKNPSLATAPPPSTTTTGVVLTEVRKTSLSGRTQTFYEDLAYAVEP